MGGHADAGGNWHSVGGGELQRLTCYPRRVWWGHGSDAAPGEKSAARGWAGAGVLPEGVAVPARVTVLSEEGKVLAGVSAAHSGVTRGRTTVGAKIHLLKVSPNPQFWGMKSLSQVPKL